MSGYEIPRKGRIGLRQQQMHVMYSCQDSDIFTTVDSTHLTVTP